MNAVTQRQQRLIEEFSKLPTWEDRYKRLIEHGKRLNPMPKEFYAEMFKVKGCQSQVWLHAALLPDKKIEFKADSDALIVKGLVALLLEVYSLATPEEILQASPDFLKELGFQSHLSPSRANGLYAMLKQILYYATVLDQLSKLDRKA
jgi:cysteine desulfuration protein SufE